MAEGARRLPWQRILAEGVLIVVSILLAFGIEAWWAGRGERRDEVDALKNLREDFVETAQRLTSASEGHGRILESSVRLLGMTGPAARLQISELAVDSLLMDLIGGPTVFPTTATLDALAGSGRLDIISSSELRRELAAWSVARAALQETEREARAQMDQRFLPFIWDYVPVVTLDLTALTEEYGEAGLNPSRFSRRYDALLAERRFENAVEERMNSSRHALERLSIAQAIVAKILSLVEQELEGAAL
jgi:hypothetical protein